MGGGSIPGFTPKEQLDTVAEGSGDAVMVASIAAPLPSVGKLKAVEKTVELLAKLRVAKGAVTGAEKAFIDPAKIANYVLNLSHPVGGHKAKVIESVLGLTVKDSAMLTSQLLRGVKQNTATLRQITQHGSQYQVVIPITGPKGVANMTTEWIVRTGESYPRLTSAYINTK